MRIGPFEVPHSMQQKLAAGCTLIGAAVAALVYYITGG